MPIARRRQALWDRIIAHRFDDPAARLTFTGRLARENGWTIGHAVRVVDEYRRFVFLALTAGHAVTPSEDVDQAWHLHLAYTRDYWQTFCRDVLRETLHHGPTRGGAAEADRYDHQYRRTLSAYAAAFDAPPPADIWPLPEQRFGSDLDWRRVNVARHWVVPKPRWFRGGGRRAMSLAGVAAVPLVAAGIPNPLDLTGPPFLTLFAALATAALVAGVALRRAVRPPGDPTVTLGELEPLELALLADDGRLRCAAAGLAAVAGGAEPPAGQEPTSGSPAFAIAPSAPVGAGPRLRAMHATLAALGACTLPEAVKTAVEVARDDLEPALVDRGLIVGPWWTSVAPWIILAPAVATIGLGVAKIVVGMSRGRPVEFLVLGCLGLAVFSLFVVARKPRRTRQGDALVHEAWKWFRESGQQDEWQRSKRGEATGAAAPLLPWAVALLGTATLGGTSFAVVEKAVDQMRAGQSGSDGGGGCGSGDGGGGCGGCGGCGGD